MTKVNIEPGICGFTTVVTAELDEDDEQTVTVKVYSGCQSVKNMMAELGDTFDSYEVCLAKPGKGPFFAYASEKFPVNAGCPIICGITKCVEAESHLALKKEVKIEFVD